MSQVQTTRGANRATGLFCVPTKTLCLHLQAVGFPLITLCNGQANGGSGREHRRATSPKQSLLDLLSLWGGQSDWCADPLVTFSNLDLGSQFPCSLETRRKWLSNGVWLLDVEIAVIKGCHNLRNNFFSLFSQQRARSDWPFNETAACTQHIREGQWYAS